MVIKLNREAAGRMIVECLDMAKKNQVDTRWIDISRAVGECPAVTYTPALGTALLAKSLNDRVDALSIKANVGENTFSLRGLCHEVLVKASVEYGFSLRTTGREPLNNQPFFRYNHVSDIERTKVSAGFDVYKHAVQEAQDLSSSQAKLAFASFLRVRLDQTIASDIVLTDVSLLDVHRAVDSLFADAAEVPKKLQALAAAVFSYFYAEIISRKLNDPSRDYPGDVQGIHAKTVVMSAECRAKAVDENDAKTFVASCARGRILRAFIVTHPDAYAPPASIADWAWLQHGVSLTIVPNIVSLLNNLLAWSPEPVRGIQNTFASRLEFYLQQIEVDISTLETWRVLSRELPGATS